MGACGAAGAGIIGDGIMPKGTVTERCIFMNAFPRWFSTIFTTVVLSNAKVVA